MSLGQPRLIRAHDHGEVPESRDCVSQCMEDRDLSRRIGQMIVASNDMGNPHERVIDHNREIVGRIAVGTQDNQIVQEVVLEDHPSFDQIINDRLAFLGGLESQRSLSSRGGDATLAAPAIIFLCQAFGLGFLPPSLQFFRTTHTPIGIPPLKQRHGVLSVEIDALRLSKWTFIPVQSNPPQPFENGLDRFLSRTALVRILDTKDEFASLAPREQPIEQGSPDPANV